MCGDIKSSPRVRHSRFLELHEVAEGFGAFAGDGFAGIAKMRRNFRRVKKRDTALTETGEQKRRVHLAAAFHEQAGDIF